MKAMLIYAVMKIKNHKQVIMNRDIIEIEIAQYLHMW